MVIDQIKDKLVNYVEGLTEHSFKGNRKGYTCPSCGSGTGKNKTGAFAIQNDGRRWKCFSCGNSGDIFDLIGLVEGLDDFPSRLKRASELFNIDISEHDSNQFIKKERGKVMNEKVLMKENEQVDYTKFYKEAHSRISETDYAKKRGLSDEILNKFLIGYDSNWKHPNVKKEVSGSPRLIIPTSKTSYFARDVRNVIPEFQQPYIKSKVGGNNLFNVKVLNQQLEQPIFVVEGEIDALSIMEVGGVAVALGSTSNVNKFMDAVTKVKLQRPLILALDNDVKGRETTEILAKHLTEKNISFIVANLMTQDIKDPNEMLVKNRELFTTFVIEAINSAKTEKEKYLDLATKHFIQDFMDGVAESTNTPFIPTGFDEIDNLLDGGLYEGLYVVGAISSLGKTTLVTQIADQIAEQGYDVLIFSLEMARSEIMAKSISRHTVKEILNVGGDMRNAKTVRGITVGSKYANYSKIERELISSAVGKYGDYAKHLFIIEGIGNIGVNEIRDTVTKHYNFTGNRPIVIVDYLQILAPLNERATDKQNTDRAVLELKRISRDFKIPLIAISSFNRENYTSPVSMQSFKESGAIEYSSDVLMGLQFKGVGESSFDVNDAKAQHPREIEVVVLKNRNGRTGTKMELEFYSMFNYFHERRAR
ncbi:DnaB-like helicase C-terminal domain-containing protein [Streptococcus pneumoniae]